MKSRIGAQLGTQEGFRGEEVHVIHPGTRDSTLQLGCWEARGGLSSRVVEVRAVEPQGAHERAKRSAANLGLRCPGDLRDPNFWSLPSTEKPSTCLHCATYSSNIFRTPPCLLPC